MITFDDLFNFIQTTYVHEDVLHLIDPNGKKIDQKTYIKFTIWEPRFDIDLLKIMWHDGFTFIVHSSRMNYELGKLIDEIEKNNNVSAQGHIYAGKIGSRSFPIHADKPDNFIVQCIGKSKVTLYNEYSDCARPSSSTESLSIKDELILEPGNSIFIPSLQFHLFEPLTDRLSVSIPMIKNDY